MRGKYDYSKFVYVNSKTKGIIICSIHGMFLQTPDAHLNGKGCRFCTKNYLIWDLNACKLDALKYKTRGEWRLNNASSYYASIRCGWLEECCKHMIDYKRYSK